MRHYAMRGALSSACPFPFEINDDAVDHPETQPEDDGGEDPDGDALEPLAWVSLDGHLLQLRRVLPRRTRDASHPVRPVPPPQARERKRARAVGDLARRARRSGVLRGRRSGQHYPVFRARRGRRTYRLVTRPRGRLRYEILFVQPEAIRSSSAPAAPVEQETSSDLRRAARATFFAAHPRLRGRQVEVHHRIPLEWKHLFPKADPNRLSNLQGLSSRDHLRKATDLWSAFRSAYRRPRKQPTPSEVLRFASLVDRSLMLPYPL